MSALFGYTRPGDGDICDLQDFAAGFEIGRFMNRLSSGYERDTGRFPAAWLPQLRALAFDRGYPSMAVEPVEDDTGDLRATFSRQPPAVAAGDPVHFWVYASDAIAAVLGSSRTLTRIRVIEAPAEDLYLVELADAGAPATIGGYLLRPEYEFSEMGTADITDYRVSAPPDWRTP